MRCAEVPFLPRDTSVRAAPGSFRQFTAAFNGWLQRLSVIVDADHACRVSLANNFAP